MKFEFDGRRLTNALIKAQQACDSLPQIAAEVTPEALGHMIVSANRSVYNTTPGAYQRTQDYLRGFQAVPRATRNTAAIRVWNDVDYAAQVELGAEPNALTPQQVVAYARARADSQVYLGRTGQNYTIAGPAVYPAAVYAERRMMELFLRKVQVAWR
jgi:hypothetical protein